MQKIDAKLSDVLRKKFLSFLANAGIDNPTLCLLKGLKENGNKEYWYFGAYGQDNIDALTPPLAARGYSLLYKLDGLIVAVPQSNYLKELEGAFLDDGKHEIHVVKEANDS